MRYIVPDIHSEESTLYQVIEEGVSQYATNDRHGTYIIFAIGQLMDLFDFGQADIENFTHALLSVTTLKVPSDTSPEPWGGVLRAARNALISVSVGREEEVEAMRVAHLL